MKNLYLIIGLIIISSCGGGGGGGSSAPDVPLVPFSLNIGLQSFSINEDETYTGSLSATANETVTLEYAITSNTTNGTLTLGSGGSITYQPNSNYNGSDSFQYSVTAVEKSVTKNATVNITVNAVDDVPTISFENSNSFSKDSLFFEESLSFRVSVQDVDTDIDSLTFDALIGDQLISASFNSDNNSNGSGEILINLNEIQTAGFYPAQLRAFDGSNRGILPFEGWFVSNKTTVTIQQDNDPEDGFDGNDKTPKQYLVYYLSGSPTSKGATKYLFVGDSLSGQSDVDLYRLALIASVNKLNDSDASDFFSQDYFSIISAEPIDPDGTSPIGVRTGCYDWDEDVYCIGEIDDSIFGVLLDDYTLVSTLTRVQGRGVNLGYKNIQRIRDTDPERTSNTLMHELGHAHGYMGDEYSTDDDRDVSAYADDNPNTSTQSDVTLLKWNHHIADQFNVLGKDIKVCYNYSDGTIADWYDTGITIAECDCFVNEWDDQGNFIQKNPACSGVGHFEGNYYGDFDNFRPTFCSIMNRCNSGGYGKVNVEAFAIGSIQNQGFYDSWDDVDFAFTENNAAWQMTLVNADYDTSKITLKWYINGVEDPSLQNQTSVIFNRPADNGVAIYTAKAVDLTGTITAIDDVLDNNDFYKGLFQSYFFWCADYDRNDGSCNDWRYDPDPSQYSSFDYGYMDGPLGLTWGINWAKW